VTRKLTHDSHRDYGGINVIYGSYGGLTALTDQTWSQDSVGMNGAGELSDHFGASLAAGVR
jgi:hypothetical protein